MAFLRQTNFLGGELSPLLWGRTDLDVFHRGLRRMRNFFPARYGGAVSRPGTLYVADARANSTPKRLIPFVFSDTQSYAIEVGITNTSHLYFRFFTDGAPLETLPGSGIPYEVIGGTTSADLAQLKYAQVGDVLTIVHPDWPPIELRRYPDNAVTGAPDWRISNVVFKPTDSYFANGYPTLQSPLPTGDATHPAKEWVWLVTLTVQDTATGKIFETYPRRVTQSWLGLPASAPVNLPSDYVVLYPDKPVTVWRRNGVSYPIDAPFITSYRELGWNIYRGRGNVYGLVGQSTNDSFIDTGADPDFAVQPPLGTNPFLITDYLGATQLVHPTAVAFFQERRCFALGGQVWLSETGNFTNFDRHTYNVAGESLLFELASRRLEETQHLVAGAKLLALTRSSAWSMGGVQGGALDFDSVDARLEDEVGSLEVAPIVLGGRVLFARAKGLGVRELQFDGNGGYRGLDISDVSAHLFKGESNGFLGTRSSRRLVDWCYQEDPFGLIWAVREDGQLLSLTHNGDDRAWARHDTNGWVQSICSVPEGEEDAVYLLVARPEQDYPLGSDFGAFGTRVQYHVERMASRIRRGNADDDCCVDDAIRVKVLQSDLGKGPVVIDGLDHLEGHQVWAVAVANPPYGPFTVVGGEIELPEPKPNSGGFTAADVQLYGEFLHYGGDCVLYVGMPFTPELETLDVADAQVRTKAKITKAVGFELDESRGVKVGQTFATVKQLIKREVSYSYDAPIPETKLFTTPVTGAWGVTGRAALRQELPLPVTVVGLVREVEFGDS